MQATENTFDKYDIAAWIIMLFAMLFVLRAHLLPALLAGLLVFELEELKLQSNGGRGLTLMDLETKDALVSVAVFGQGLRVLGLGRGGKSKEEVLRSSALEPYKAKRARKGKTLDMGLKPQRVLQA